MLEAWEELRSVMKAENVREKILKGTKSIKYTEVIAHSCVI